VDKFSKKDPVTDPGVLLRRLVPSKVDVEKNDFMRNFPHFNDQETESYKTAIRRGKTMNLL